MKWKLTGLRFNKEFTEDHSEKVTFEQRLQRLRSKQQSKSPKLTREKQLNNIEYSKPGKCSVSSRTPIVAGAC